jgi:hypothetical protein
VPHLILHLVLVGARHIKKLGSLHGATGLQGGGRQSATGRAGGGGSTPRTAAALLRGCRSHLHTGGSCEAGRQGVEAKGRMGRCDHAASEPASGGLYRCNRTIRQCGKNRKGQEALNASTATTTRCICVPPSRRRRHRPILGSVNPELCRQNCRVLSGCNWDLPNSPRRPDLGPPGL